MTLPSSIFWLIGWGQNRTSPSEQLRNMNYSFDPTVLQIAFTKTSKYFYLTNQESMY